MLERLTFKCEQHKDHRGNLNSQLVNILILHVLVNDNLQLHTFLPHIPHVPETPTCNSTDEINNVLFLECMELYL